MWSSVSLLVCSGLRPAIQLFGVARPLDDDVRGGAVDLAQVIRRELNIGGTDVLLKARWLGSPRDRDDPRLLRKQPGERQLSRGCMLTLCDPAEQIDQGQVSLASFRGKAGKHVAKV